MFGYLDGKVLTKNAETLQLVLKTFRVGFEVTVPRRLFDALTEGQSIALWIHTHVREDVLALYGFPSEAERFFFKALLGVSGLGPKTAMALLSEHSSEKLVRLILNKEVAEISTAQGVGKKTAERICLELASKAEKWTWIEKVEKSSSEKPRRENISASVQLKEDLSSALGNLGYVPSQIKLVVERVLEDSTLQEQGFEICLRQALREISNRPLTTERSHA